MTSALPLTPAGPSVYRGIMRFETFMNNSIPYNSPPPPSFCVVAPSICDRQKPNQITADMYGLCIVA
jgi:hypothetical protein